VAAQELGEFKQDVSALGPRMSEIATQDKAYRVRAMALRSLAELNAPNAYDTLVTAVASDSPDDVLRNAALRGFRELGDSRAVPLLLDWSSLGKPFESRSAAIGSIAGMDKGNEKITRALISYLEEPYFDIKISAVLALGERGDTTAIKPLEDLVKSGDLSLGTAPFVEEQIAALKASGKSRGDSNEHGTSAESASPAASGDQQAVINTLKILQRQMDEVNARLAKIESRLGAEK